MRSDDVDELREAGDVDSIRVAEQRVEKAAYQQRVLEVVDLLEQVRRDGAAAVGRRLVTRAIPDVPFVERQPQALARFLQALDIVADGSDLVDVPIHVEVHREVARRVGPARRRRVAVVGVQRNAVDLVVAFLEHLAIPGEIRRHRWRTGSAGDQPQVGRDDPHLFRGIARLAAVFACLQLPNLPRSVHFVAEAPIADVVRLFIAMRTPQVAPLRAALQIAGTRRRRPPSRPSRFRS